MQFDSLKYMLFFPAVWAVYGAVALYGWPAQAPAGGGLTGPMQMNVLRVGPNVTD